MTRALVYGDVNLNVLDGSAIWVQSMVEALSRCDVDVTLLLKAPVTTGRLVDPIAAMPRVTVVRPHEEGLVPRRSHLLDREHAVEIMRRLDEQQRFDLVVMRGLRAVDVAAKDGAFDGRLWTYLTDHAQTVTALTPAAIEQLERISAASRFMLCQTEELRSFLESAVSAACGRSVLWTPTVPAPDFELPEREPREGRPLRLVYTGKFAPLWNTLEMTRLPQRLAEAGVSAELHMVGDKVHEVPTDPSWAPAMQAALSSSPGVVWHGGMPRQEAMRTSAAMDIGLSWRDPAMDGSLELSTKVLEFGALDVPVILNRTQMHEDLFGVDYPLFVQGEDDVVDAVAAVAQDPELYESARTRCREVSASFSMDVAVERMRGHLARAFPTAGSAAPSLAGRSRRLRVGVASHDLKFFSRMLDHLSALPELEVRVDQWSALAVNDPAQSQEILDWADVIIAEWCGPVAVWYSQRKRPGQRLIVRLHRFELDAAWIKDVVIDNVDQMVCVSPFYGQLTAQRTGWPKDKIVVVPNWVDVDQLDRPKLEGAQFHLGMIGIAPMRKRMDLGLDVLERVRRQDDRFTLFAKSKLPWDYWWIWRKAHEQEHFDEVFRRIQTSPHLRGAVVFDDFGGDVAAWLRRIGWVLSTSDDESFHLAPAEGMASGAVPALLPWPGADTIYHQRWIDEDVDAMAERILTTVHEDRWEAEGLRAQQHLSASFPLDAVCAAWTRLLVENASPDTAQGTLAPED
ncbi:MAG: glycosyltransferase [Frankiales bacterium]|nr:glycosyltransferase [Frankiales bacterium]